ncbi:hypothetical protein HWV62_9555 [Athelia sp. TMB]|nr:hypothetical protein HWV62_9555 [Athelia sp. TMB]
MQVPLDLMYALILTVYSHNFPRKAIGAPHISAETEFRVVDNLALLAAGRNTTDLTCADDALVLADGYSAELRYLLVLRTCLAGAAALVGFALVQYWSLLRGDSEALKRDARDAGLAVQLAEQQRKRERDRELYDIRLWFGCEVDG